MVKVAKQQTLHNFSNIFQSVNQVYYRSKPTTAEDLQREDIEVDMELPILDDGVVINSGEKSFTNNKLTSNKIWNIKSKLSESEITFKVASIDGIVNRLLLNEQKNIDKTFISLSSYNLIQKVIKGSLFLFSEDKNCIIVLSNVSITSNFVIEQGKSAYFLINIVPFSNKDDDVVFILHKDNNIYIVDNNDNKLVTEQNVLIVSDRQ